MKRKEFPQSVVESVLIKCRRHCCVCGKWCGQKIEIHHIENPNDNSEENAIPVCFDCHAEIGSYNLKHPKGRKFTTGELKKLRDEAYKKFSFSSIILPQTTTEYGKGFHDGFEWAEKINNIKEIWRFISTHGDFAIEILIYFEDDDVHTMMDELLFSNVDTGMNITQKDGHISAWSSGSILGLWNVDANEEVLFLTKKGKIFREIVLKTPEIKNRYNQLKNFWFDLDINNSSKKPSTNNYEYRVSHAGILNWLQTEIFKVVRIDSFKDQFIIWNVTYYNVSFKNIENGAIVQYLEEDIKDVVLDKKTDELLIILK